MLGSTTIGRKGSGLAPLGLDGKKKQKKKKKKRHGYTVANIDSDTMREVQKNLAQQEQARKCSDSRVHQLAREYSQKIKDKSKLQKKYSTVFEDDEIDGIFDEPGKPEWLSQLGLKKRQSSTGNVLDGAGLEDECSSTGSGEAHPLHLRQSDDDLTGSLSHHLDVDRGSRTAQKHHTLSHLQHHRAWVEEEAKTGKLKGWVRSIAAKFGKKEGTTL